LWIPWKKTSEKCLDSQLWHAGAGAMVQMPPLNTRVFYFPQGHAEHAHGKVDFSKTRVPALILCRISAMKYMADADTDEVYVKMRLNPLRENEMGSEEVCFIGNNGLEGQEKPASFAKTLTQSDANNEPPVQTIIAKDMHGQCWKFRHIYRGTPRRHLLTTGWSNFVNHKKLVAELKNGDLCVGIRRAKKGGIGGGTDQFSNSSGNWNRVSSSPLFGAGNFLCGNENRKVASESVIEAVNCVVNGRSFEVVYYPRASTPEFCVKVSSVKSAMQIQWCSGARPTVNKSSRRLLAFRTQQHTSTPPDSACSHSVQKQLWIPWKKTSEKCLDSQLWHAGAGAMVQMPPLNTRVFYFPQGHAEHAHGKNLCHEIHADADTDEVYVKMRLTPLRENEMGSEEVCFIGNNGLEGQEKPASFSKTLTQSDANNEPPVQTIIAKDMHGQCWKFRHIYRGTPRRHLLTTGWSNFVNHKKLVAGDSIVFSRAEKWRSLCWYKESKERKVAFESVIEAVNCVVNGRSFEVVYYPRASTPEFCVKVSSVKSAMQIQWCSGMRFKTPFSAAHFPPHEAYASLSKKIK
ncbi:hypothetical protein RYX36_014778, partial [Vicia faba]